MRKENAPLRRFPDGSANYGDGIIGPSLRDQEDANSGAMGPLKLDKKKMLREVAMVGGGTVVNFGILAAALTSSFMTESLNPITNRHPNWVLAGVFIGSIPFRYVSSRADLDMIKKFGTSPNFIANRVFDLFPNPSKIRDISTRASGAIGLDWMRIISALNSPEVLTAVVAAQVASIAANTVRTSVEIVAIKASNEEKAKKLPKADMVFDAKAVPVAVGD